MSAGSSIEFFDRQFRQQVGSDAAELNPFEALALEHLHGRVLDLGCGLGHLALAAARRGCSVLALDGSGTAIEHLRRTVHARRLPIDARQIDLRHYRIDQTFDSIVSIGLLMFFDCPTAFRLLDDIRGHVRPGGTAAVNVLVEGTTYLEMFDALGHCLFAGDELRRRFAPWEIVAERRQTFDAPAPAPSNCDWRTGSTLDRVRVVPDRHARPAHESLGHAALPADRGTVAWYCRRPRC